jgi:HSP20 family molecular chaperone IbpA
MEVPKMAEKTVPATREDQPAPAQEPTRNSERYLAPAVDIYETKDGLVVLADLPGVKLENVDVRVDEGVLTIEGRTSHNPAANPIYREFALASFFRQFQLPEQVDVAAIGASLDNGVLRVALPWAAKVKPRKIEVRGA